jgi:hypothetical protein
MRPNTSAKVRSSSSGKVDVGGVTGAFSSATAPAFGKVAKLMRNPTRKRDRNEREIMVFTRSFSVD